MDLSGTLIANKPVRCPICISVLPGLSQCILLRIWNSQKHLSSVFCKMISSKFIINVHSLLKAALYFRGHDLVPTFNHFRPPPLYADQLTCHTPKVKSPNTCLHPMPLTRSNNKSKATQFYEANIAFAEWAFPSSHSLDITQQNRMSWPDSKSIYQM